MPFVPVENTALVEARMLFAGQKCENTFWVQRPDGPWDAGSLALLASLVKEWWDGSYATICTSQVSLREIVCTDMTTDTGGQVSVSGAGSFGLDELGSQASNVTFTVSFRTALRGRSFRGRNYIVGVPSSNIELINFVDEDYIEAVIAAYTDLKSAIEGEDFVWVIASRFSGVDGDGHPIPREAGVVTPVTNVIVADNVIDSQRRRLPGRGT